MQGWQGNWWWALLALGFSACGKTSPDEAQDAGIGTAELIAWEIRMSVCSGGAIGETLSSQLYDDSDVLSARAEQIACAAKTSSCADALACMGVDVERTCDPETFDPGCADATTVDACVDYSNGIHVLFESPCSALDPTGLNATCVETDGWAVCSSGPCHEEGSRCEGDVQVRCHDGAEVRLDCAASDLNCIEGDQRVFCGRLNALCRDDEYYIFICDGDALLQCRDGYERNRIDCGRRLEGATCLPWPEAQPEGRCGFADATAECAEYGAQCVGAVARVCAGGRWFDFDCSTFLDADCEPMGAPMSNEHGVRCKAPSWP